MVTQHTMESLLEQNARIGVEALDMIGVIYMELLMHIYVLVRLSRYRETITGRKIQMSVNQLVRMNIKTIHA